MTTLHEPVRFVISLAPITKKNSQQIIYLGPKCPRCGRGSKVCPLPSAKYRQYEREAYKYMPPDTDTIDYPVNIQAIYYMPTRRRVDLMNLHEALHDVLVKYQVIADDNSNIVASTDGSRVRYDKNNPRTEIEITEVADEPYQMGMEV